MEESWDDKHLKVMEAILPYAKPNSQSNLTEVVIENVTRKNKLLFFLLPEWAVNFPPYNLARLVSVVRDAGYSAKAIDLNIEAFKEYENWNIDFNPWHGSKEWRWMGDSYNQYLHHYMQPLLQKYIDQIEKENVTIVAFTLYYCNQEPTDWMAREIKRRYPHIKIIVGGPQCHSFPPGPEKGYYDHVVSGEGEEIILKLLEKIERNEIVPRYFEQKDGQRLNLDKLPWADYRDFNLANYRMPNGVNAEFSRGCTAKCVFCSETHFWKYRGRQSLGVLQEILTLNEKYGTDFVWFLDSLVNGNVNELRAFCKGLIASGVKINWTGYARCDKRMDNDYYKDLGDAGCTMLSYGIESGSNKVLKDMDKRITVDIIEQNLKDGAQYRVAAHTNWIIGFPTETPQDFYESMTLMWRNKEYLDNISTGHGFTEPPDTILSQNSEKYGMIKSYYMENWITGDFKNSKVHRLIRLIAVNILLTHTPHPNPEKLFRNIDTTKYHTIKFRDPNKLQNVEWEEFDFEVIKPGINPLADSVINEIWPLLRLLWKARGGYKLELHITPEDAYAEFGDRLGCNLSANLVFKIDDDGNWGVKFNYKFDQDDNAWRYMDYSKENSMAAQRARMLAIPGSKGEVQWTEEKFKKDLALVEELKKKDFSFKYRAKHNGSWK